MNTCKILARVQVAICAMVKLLLAVHSSIQITAKTISRWHCMCARYNMQPQIKLKAPNIVLSASMVAPSKFTQTDRQSSQLRLSHNNASRYLVWPGRQALLPVSRTRSHVLYIRTEGALWILSSRLPGPATGNPHEAVHNLCLSTWRVQWTTAQRGTSSRCWGSFLCPFIYTMYYVHSYME